MILDKYLDPLLSLFFKSFDICILTVFLLGCFCIILSRVRARRQQAYMEEDEKPSSEIDRWWNQFIIGKHWLYELEIVRIHEYLDNEYLDKKVDWDIANWEANIADTHPTPFYKTISICSHVLVIIGLLGTLYAIKEGITNFQGDLSALKNGVVFAVKTSLKGILFGTLLLLIAASARERWEKMLDLLKKEVKASLSSQPSEQQISTENVDDERREILNILRTNLNDMNETLKGWKETFDNDSKDFRKTIQEFTVSLNNYRTVQTSDKETAQQLLRDIDGLQTLINRRCTRLDEHESELRSILQELNQKLQQRSNGPTQQEKEE